MATISTHNGSNASHKHNIRDVSVVSKEPHIDLSRPHETWIDRDIKAVYRDIFGEAVQEYNSRQQRADRQIHDYYSKIKGSKDRHVCYEMIIGVYDNVTPVETKREILKEFVDTWDARNPNMPLVGAYYHADEQGKDPHVHIDYIPVAHNLSRGMRTQNALAKALEEMGYQTHGRSHTSQTAWVHRQNEYLEYLCNRRGIAVTHNAVKRDHIDTAEYKIAMQRIDKALTHIDELMQSLDTPPGKDLPGGVTLMRQSDITQLMQICSNLRAEVASVKAMQEYTDVKSVRALQIDTEMYKQLHERSDTMYLREHDKVVKLTDELAQSERLNDWYALRDKLASTKSDIEIDKNYIVAAKEHDLD